MGEVSSVQRVLMEIRDERGCSIAELARACGLHNRTMENYFKGHSPSAEAIAAISTGLGVSADRLLGLVSGRAGADETAKRAIKVAAQAMLDAMAGYEGRDFSIARTKIEEAVMWAVKGITK